jgi:hypothetical protein
MSNTNQNFEDSGGFGQDEAESEDHENDLYDQPLENVEDRSQYLNIPLNSIGNLPMNDILNFQSKKLSNHIIKFRFVYRYRIRKRPHFLFKLEVITISMNLKLYQVNSVLWLSIVFF